MKPLVVIFSQDAQFYLMLSHILEVDGFATEHVNSIAEALSVSRTRTIGIFVLDCREQNRIVFQSAALKQDPRTSALPIVALFAPGSEEQQFQAIKAGITELLVSPFVPRQLLELLRTTLRSEAVPPKHSGHTIVYGDIEMDVVSHRVLARGSEMPVGPIDYRILGKLLAQPERVFSRQELIEAGWNSGSEVGFRTVDVHMSLLRRLLQRFSSMVSIRTVRLVGYSLDKRPRGPT